MRQLVTNTNKQRGDTLVEVLLAIAVVSLILGGAYVTTNRSLLATRAAQERGIALKLAESQIEQIKGLVATNPNLLFGATAISPFCVSPTTNQPVTASDPGCMVDTSGTPTSAQPNFRLSVVRNSNTFTLTETWSNVDGRNADRLQMSYRIYD